IAVFAYLLMCCYQAVEFALFAWAARRIRARWQLPMALVAPVVMVAFELVVPMLFPWYLAITQAWQIHVIQVADLTGPLGVSALLRMVTGALYALLRARRWRPAAAAAGIVALALVYGEMRIRQTELAVARAPTAKIGLVQGNVPFNEKGYEHPDLAEKQLAE